MPKPRAAPFAPARYFERLLQPGLPLQIAQVRVNRKLGRMPDSVNKDPADRLIVATALVEQAVLVTADENLRQSEAITTLW
ncbi:MAG: hypothetical protein Kow0031_22880 [Anaerolineae bacterium]